MKTREEYEKTIKTIYTLPIWDNKMWGKCVSCTPVKIFGIVVAYKWRIKRIIK